MLTEQNTLPRRDMLLKSGAGFGAVALAGLMNGAAASAKSSGPSPLTAKLTHRPCQAKSVIFLFMEGGPSHMDTFDPKPLL